MKALNMKRLALALLGMAALPLFVFSGVVYAQNTQNFTIVSFEADYYLDRDADKTSTLRVEEIIVAEFPDRDQNHGILRAIPERYQDHTLSLQIESVKKANGQNWNYTTTSQADNLVLKIGDADSYVRGRQTYKISYTMRNVAAFFDEHEEFYWDINGDQWRQPFDAVTARIHVAPELAATLQSRQKCFAGSYGQTGEDTCEITRATEANGGVVITATARNLSPQQTLTAVLAFEKDTFMPGSEIAAEKRQKILLVVAIAVGAIGPPLITGIWAYRRWRKFGRDPAGRGVIVPQYQPPQGFNPLMASAILREHVESKAVSALMIELAVGKYLRIHEIPKKGLFSGTDYELEIIRDPSDLDAEQMQALRMFFKDGMVVGASVVLSDLKSKLGIEQGALSKSVETQLHTAGYFINNPSKARGYYVKRGAILIIIATFLFYIWPLAIGVGLSGFLLILLRNTMPARSAKGVSAREHILGLKDYMQLAEAERIRFLQSPEGALKIPSGTDPNDPKQQVQLFEKLLPYAMLFGVEKDWAKQFKDLYSQPPDWYQGNWSSFNAVYLASSLGGFSSASITSFSSASSSGSSGFGGGGFSGGGGGGGGGGGW